MIYKYRSTILNFHKMEMISSPLKTVYKLDIENGKFIFSDNKIDWLVIPDADQIEIKKFYIKYLQGELLK